MAQNHPNRAECRRASHLVILRRRSMTLTSRGPVHRPGTGAEAPTLSGAAALHGGLRAPPGPAPCAGSSGGPWDAPGRACWVLAVHHHGGRGASGRGPGGSPCGVHVRRHQGCEQCGVPAVSPGVQQAPGSSTRWRPLRLICAFLAPIRPPKPTSGPSSSIPATWGTTAPSTRHGPRASSTAWSGTCLSTSRQVP